jgi:5-deoxy-D-glucuronate isomerase
METQPTSHLISHRGGFSVGVTKVLSLGDGRGVDIAFYMVRLESNTSLDVPPVFHQCAAVLLTGSGSVTVCPKRGEELPPVEVKPAQVRAEERGQGQLGGTFHRQVRTVADASNARGWGLVFGEVVNQAGRWSSYPPHHHPQPEIYYYRFDKPAGYGHAEIGEHVVKVKSHDITLMRSGEDHAQVSAPGYAMYYLWVIRNLKDQAYDTPEFTEEHRWLLSAQ